ncbi:hypothetical protein B0H15DRAFT_807275 [Mycena belliarum]|uniref:Uncharacterized protein n=1 Tax=Mycena belliarum TaxID=1033014 RepID=A0AAD6XL20_9AGAR|nr:hypothetical protein B0H15DRAFT_807275 [Mycena belliae]
MAKTCLTVLQPFGACQRERPHLLVPLPVTGWLYTTTYDFFWMRGGDLPPYPCEHQVFTRNVKPTSATRGQFITIPARPFSSSATHRTAPSSSAPHPARHSVSATARPAVRPPPASASWQPLAAFDNVLEDIRNEFVLDPILALESYRQKEAQKLAVLTNRLDSLPGVSTPSPSPDISLEEALDAALARQEENDLREAMHQSTIPQSSAPFPSLFCSPSPTPTGSIGPHLRHLSPSPDFPAQPLLDDYPRSQQRVRSSAASTQPSLQITKQLNNDWLSAVPTDTLHIAPTGGGRRPFKKTLAVRRFLLVYFDKANAAPQQRFVTECPDWPSWQLSTAVGTLASLGETLTRIEHYTTTFRTWIQVPLDFVHELTTDCVVLLRRHGVRGVDEASTIERFFPQAEPSHIRYGLSQERAAVRKTYKASKTEVFDISSDSEDAVEIVKVKRRKRIDSPARPSQRRRISLDTTVVVNRVSPSSSSSTLWTPYNLSTPDTTPPPSTSLLSFSPSPPSLSATQRWPASEYVIDMVEGFKQMASQELSHMPVGRRFRKIYGNLRVYKQQTYSDQVRRWMSATEDQRKAARDAGRTKEGLWSTFAKSVPLRR